MLFFHLFSIALESFYYGVLLAAVTMIIMYFILQMISKTCVKTLPFYISGVFLAILLIIQDTCLVAEFKALGLVDSAEILIQQNIGAYSGPMNLQDTQAVLDIVTANIPIIGAFANITNIEVENAQELARVMSEAMRDKLVACIWESIGWCAAFITVAVLITFFADKGKGRAAQSAPARHRSGSDRHVGRSGRRHRF